MTAQYQSPRLRLGVRGWCAGECAGLFFFDFNPARKRLTTKKYENINYTILQSLPPPSQFLKFLIPII